MTTDPQIPLWFDALGLLLPFAMLALLVAALITLVRATGLSSGQRVAWAVALVVVPIMGPAVWLISRAITRHARPPVA